MPTDINREAVKRLITQGAQVVDVLPEAEFQEAHLPGARNLPLKKLNRESAGQLDATQPIITYCQDAQ